MTRPLCSRGMVPYREQGAKYHLRGAANPAVLSSCVIRKQRHLLRCPSVSAPRAGPTRILED